MSKIGIELPKEYSDRFDKLRQNRVEVSFYKYGTAADNFRMKLVDALESHDMCIKKYKETGNTEYLCDAANYLMFEFMYPQIPNAYRILRSCAKTVMSMWTRPHGYIGW